MATEAPATPPTAPMDDFDMELLGPAQPCTRRSRMLIQWQVRIQATTDENRWGSAWQDYNPSDNLRIESAWQCNLGMIIMPNLDNPAEGDWRIDLNAREQENTETHTRRPIRRLVVTLS